MRNVKEFENIHQGRPAVVMGGGPSLKNHVNYMLWFTIRKSAVWIAVNFHALEIGLVADYMVFGDKLEKVPVMRPYVEKYQGIRVSPYEASDVYLDPEVAWLQGGNSGALAAWWGCFLGCDPVILAGMDCYQGLVKYCHNIPVPDHPCREYPLESHLMAWRRVLKYCPGSERIRAAGGPLVQIFGHWGDL